MSTFLVSQTLLLFISYFFYFIIINDSVVRNLFIKFAPNTNRNRYDSRHINSSITY